MTALAVLFLAATLGLLVVSARVNTRIENDQAEKDHAAAELYWSAFRLAPSPGAARYGRLVQARARVTA